MRAVVMDPGDQRWHRVLRTTRHDFFALPGFVALSARAHDARPVAVLAGEGDRQVLIPLLLRTVPSFGDASGSERPVLDAMSPYGYPGLTLTHAARTGRDPAGFLGAALDAALDALRAAGVVSVFLRLHPLLPVDTAPLAARGTVVTHGHTVSIDLRRDRDHLLPDLRRSYARQIRRLGRLGYVSEIDEHCRPASVEAFLGVYTETMDRVGASSSYYVDAGYVHELYDALSGRLHISLIRRGDEVAGAGLFTTVDGIVQDFLGGTRRAHLREGPHRLEVVAIAEWARSRGNQVYHLGGGLGGTEDSLFDYKAGYSRERHPFHTARLVLDPVAVAGLDRAWSARAGHPAAGPAAFFPAYRAPLPAAAPVAAGGVGAGVGTTIGGGGSGRAAD